MRAWILLIALAAAAPSRALASGMDRLGPGVYDCELRGLVCYACATAILQEVRRVDGVEAARIDFDRRVLRVTIARGKRVPLSWIRRALGRAARRVDLGPPYTLGEVRYVP